MTHNVRHLRASDARPFSRSVPKVRESSLRDRAIFSGEFDTSDDLKNRCGFRRNHWIRQVPISRTLSVCGEVAERLKAAVC
jgi:hypothetical protein